MNKRYFITGTDTGVGKTLVTAALMTAIQERNRTCIPIKPVQCGTRGDTEDLEWCLSFSNQPVKPEWKNDMNPYRFNLAASPHLAAAQENVEISVERIMESINRLGKLADVLLIEGAGGLLVPLNDKAYVIDLIALAESSPILVTRAGLGTLNHTALSLHELSRAGLHASAVVVNETALPANEDEIRIRDDNIRLIRKMAAPAPVLVLRHMPRITMSALLEFGTKLADALDAG